MIKMSIHLSDGKHHVQYISKNTMRDIVENIHLHDYLTFHDSHSKSMYNMNHVTKIQFDDQKGESNYEQ